jgi:hypothetical protein
MDIPERLMKAAEMAADSGCARDQRPGGTSGRGHGYTVPGRTC